MRNLYLAHVHESVLLVIALFCIVFATVPINFPVFVTTYAATLAVYAWALAAGMRTRRGINRTARVKRRTEHWQKAPPRPGISSIIYIT